MQMKTSQAAEDYLKVIYELTRKAKRASTNEIAELMEVTPASVTGMLQKLANLHPPLIRYEKHRGAGLTRKGEQVALEVIRHHRLLETFLQAKLDYTWDEVHDEADRLEHVISEEMEERIARVLNNPNYDPHGDPIPSRDFRLPQQSSMTLAEAHSGDQVTVVRISTSDPKLLRYLATIPLTLQSRILVKEISPFDGNMALEVAERADAFILGPGITGKIYVRIDIDSH